MIKSRRERHVILILISVVIFSLLVQPIIRDYGHYLTTSGLYESGKDTKNDRYYELEYNLGYKDLIDRVWHLTWLPLGTTPIRAIYVINEGHESAKGFYIFLALLPWSTIPFMYMITKKIENISIPRRLFYIFTVASQMSIIY